MSEALSVKRRCAKGKSATQPLEIRRSWKLKLHRATTSKCRQPILENRLDQMPNAPTDSAQQQKYKHYYGETISLNFLYRFLSEAPVRLRKVWWRVLCLSA